MQSYQQRVIDEKAELDGKREKLCAFLSSPNTGSIPVQELARLRRQSGIMEQYRDVLAERIAAFTE